MMNMSQCSAQLRALCEQHANYQITFENYRDQRKALLNSLDKHYNGVIAEQVDVLPEPVQQTEEQQDKTQPYLASKIGQCISFLKRNSDS